MVSWQTVQVVSLISGIDGILKTVVAAPICASVGLTITFSMAFRNVAPKGIVCRPGIFVRFKREVSKFAESRKSGSNADE
jgi:hypothetical protein